jgi:hypothetical protein
MPFVEKPVGWLEFVEEARELGRDWIFRGGLQHWALQTTLERACRTWGIPADRLPAAERRSVRDFQRHPEGQQLGLERPDYLGWFAVMQHYGAPSRLLDWSYSPFVAAHFAFDALFLDQSTVAEGEGQIRAKVWALDTGWLKNAALPRVLPRLELTWCEDEKTPESFAKLYMEHDPRLAFVAPATPFILNRRLSRQQGTFLCPGDVSRPWMDNLNALAPGDDPAHTRSFVMTRASMPGAFEALGKMNVTARTLFPGLAGYAKSMHHRLKLLLDLDVKGSV